MPLFRRLPKRGFNNFNFETRYKIINVSQLERFDEGATVGVEQLSNAGLIDSLKNKVKILDAPKEYPEYGGPYYAVYFTDPDGSKLKGMHFPK